MGQNNDFSQKELLPPPELIHYVGGDFQKVGEEFLKYFIEIGNLQRHESILDVGCGVGRMAVPLTKYINDKALYHGFDIFQDGISWCQSHISPTYKNFHFQHANIYHQFYNPNGTIKASEFQFPYEDDTFDFTYLTSVFTHLLEKELEHYVSEISRVIKQDGRCLLTLFLLNPDSSYYLTSRLSTLPFYHKMDNCYIVNKDIPEFAVAYPEEWMLNLLSQYNFEVTKPIYYGSWCGRTTFTSYQDILVIRKK